MKAVLVVALATIGLALSGCGSKTQKASPAPTTTTASTATTAPPVPSTTTPATTSVSSTTIAPVPPTTAVAATTTVPPGPVACTSSQLSLSLGEQGAGLGHVGVAILFRNTSKVTCVLSGYPGVAFLNSAGQQAAQATRTPSGYLGGLVTSATVPPVVSVGPGLAVSALLEGTDNPAGGGTSCPNYPAILVTPPNLRVSVRLAGGVPGCSPPMIHPVVAGSTGRQGA